MFLTEFFIKRPLLTQLTTVLIFIIGLLSALHLKRATYPNVNFDILKITTEYPGASTEDVETNVTRKVEKELESVQGIDRIRSISLENVSIIFVFVDLDHNNTDQVKDEIRNAVDRVNDFPQEVTNRPKIDEIRSSNVPVIEIALLGNAEDERLMREVIKDLEEDLKEIKGIASVEKVGYRKREVKILADANKLKEYYFSLLDIVRAVSDRNVHSSGGTIASFKDAKKVVSFSEFLKPTDANNVILRSNFYGKQVKINEVARVVDGFEKYEVMSRTEKRQSINLLVRAQANADVIDISDEIKKHLEKERKNLPPNLTLKIVSDFSLYTKSLLNILKNNALIGIVLVLSCLMIFLTTMTAFWTAIGIPLSFLGAFIFFPLFDISINFISMITLILVLGLLVDDAIVVAENITKHLEEGKGKVEAALAGTKEMFWPVFTTIVTSILAFIPMFFMTGVTGKFITEIPIVVILTLIFSLFECTLILPAHMAHGPKIKPRKNLWFNKVKKVYERFLIKALKYRAVTLGAFVLFLVLTSVLFVTKMKFMLFPYDDIDVFYVITEMPQGTSIEKTSEKMKEVEDVVDQISRDEMVSFTTTIGHHNTNVYGANLGQHENWAMITVFLKTASERERDSAEIMSEVEEKLKSVKGFDRLYIEKFNDGPPVGKPITISVVGKKDSLREEMATRIWNFLKETKGVRGLDIDNKKGKKELRIIPDYSKMARFGITSLQVAQVLRTAFQGLVPMSITREGEEIDFRVQLDTDADVTQEILKSLQIPNNVGRLISLGSFTHITKREGKQLVRHYNGRRSITITGDVDEKITTSTEVNQKVHDKFFKEVQTTPGLRIYFGGEEKATKESLESFIVAFCCALIAIYFVLIILLNSYIQPFIILASVPFGLAGVIIVFFLHGLPISFLGMIGCIGVLGIIVNDSLIIVSHYNSLSKKHVVNMQLILRGAKDRIRAVLLTTITTVSGMIPTIYGFGGYEPFIVPIVLAVAGGLIFATAITLLLIPILYSFKVKKI